MRNHPDTNAALYAILTSIGLAVALPIAYALDAQVPGASHRSMAGLLLALLVVALLVTNSRLAAVRRCAEYRRTLPLDRPASGQTGADKAVEWLAAKVDSLLTDLGILVILAIPVVIIVLVIVPIAKVLT